MPGALRTLAAHEPGYRGRYLGGPAERDAAYHEGTAWAWLIGPFVEAHLRVYRDPAAAISFLEPFALQAETYGLGSVGEIFDGDAPFAPRGCISQAWSVAEALRVWSAAASFGGVQKGKSKAYLTAKPAQSRGRKKLPPERSPRKPSRSKRG